MTQPSLPSTKPSVAEPAVLEGKRRLGPGDSFCFSCSAGLSCFTSCCANVNIVLTPADVMFLARRTGLGTHEFLERHTLTPITRDLHLPVVMLRMGDAPEKRCPFVGPAGCKVYDDRPWACRMYPLGVAVPPARAGVEPEPLHFLFEDDFCHGREAGEQWTVQAWRASHGIAEREELEKGFQDIVSHPWFIGGRRLDPRRIEMFFLAVYDLDVFRSMALSPGFQQRFEIEPSVRDAIGTDDAALLRFGFRWLRYALFGEPTMAVRPAAARAARAAFSRSQRAGA